MLYLKNPMKYLLKRFPIQKMFQKKSRTRPLYKQLFNLRENVQNRTKLLNFKRKKWEKLIKHYSKSLKFYNKYKLYDQTQYTMNENTNRWNSYKNRFKRNMFDSKKLRLFYGNMSKGELKKLIRYSNSSNLKKKHINLLFLELVEHRLDTVLYRAKFSKSLRNSRQLITHCKIKVNNIIVKTPSYVLKPGDLIKITNNSTYIVKNNLKFCLNNRKKYSATLWPIPPKHLLINYKTLEIFFCKIQPTNFSTDFLFNLKLEKVLLRF